MKTRFRTTYLTVATILAAGVLALNANAQCGGADTHAMSAMTLKTLKHSMLSAGVAVGRGESDEDKDDDVSIVGFWHVKFISKGNAGIGIPDDTELDNGFAQWHPDHTEIMNSNRPPATSNFCLGVWEKKGHFNYKLNHFALSSQPNGTLIGPTNIREEVTVDASGNGYTGSFAIQQFDLKGNPMGPLVTGNISAKRITVDTTGQDLFK